ncbi:MAG: glycosyltransferase 87 family protein [Myxococcota bacterium]
MWWDGADLVRLYDYRWFTAQAQRAGFGDQLVGFAVLTPPSTLLAAPLLPLGPELAGIGWLVGQVLLGTLTIAALSAALDLPAWLLGAIALSMWPALGAHLVQGQFHLPAVCALALGYLAYQRQRSLFAGILWGLAAGLKVHAWPIVLLAAMARERTVVFAAAGTLLLGGAVSVLLVGWPLHGVWLREIVPASASGFFVHPWHPAYQGIGQASRILLHPMPGMNVAWSDAPRLAAAIPAALSALMVGITACGGLSWPEKSVAHRSQLLGAAAICALVSGPILSMYHLTLLIPPVIWTAAWGLRSGERGRAAAILVLAVLAVWSPISMSLPDPASPLEVVLGFPRLFLVLALWGAMMPWRPSALERRGRWVVVLFAVIVGGRAQPPPVGAANPLWDPEAPLIAADLIGTDDGSLWFSGLTGDRRGHEGRGWVGFRLPPGRDETVEIVAASATSHVWSPVPVAPDRVLWNGAAEAVRPGPGGGRLVAREVDGQRDIFLITVDGRDIRLTTHPAHDDEPVWDRQRGRIWFLSDRGVGVRALRLWWIPEPKTLF